MFETIAKITLDYFLTCESFKQIGQGRSNSLRADSKKKNTPAKMWPVTSIVIKNGQNKS